MGFPGVIVKIKMGLDLKKISVTTWIILAGIFLYTASLWQRPLFVPEFICNAGAIDALTNGTAPSPGDVLHCFVFKFFGTTPFTFRIVPALLTLLAAGAIFLAGSFTERSNTAKGGVIIFLLTPVVFLSGTSALSFIYNGAPLVISFWLLFMTSESDRQVQKIPAGVGAALFLLITLFLWGGVTHLLFLFAVWCIYGLLTVFICDVSGAKKKFLAVLSSLLPFVPSLLLIPFAAQGSAPLQCQGLKTVAAVVVAGSFPWVIFLPALLKNLSVRFSLIIHERFTLAAFLLAAASLAALFVMPLSGGFFIPCLAGSAVLLAALLEMEHAENGFRAANVVLYILAALFFLAAGALTAYGILGAYTKVLKPAWKIFTARDAWCLTAIVPAVAAVWCLTGAWEKISKERKFLSLAAGTAFLLLAFHGLVPLKIVENNAPVNFLQKVVMPRTGTEAVFYGDAAMVAPLQCVFKKSPVKAFSFEKDLTEIKKALRSKERMCVITLSRSVSKKMPFPKTTLRSGNFNAVFYNIDFPEMRGRKP